MAHIKRFRQLFCKHKIGNVEMLANGDMRTVCPKCGSIRMLTDKKLSEMDAMGMGDAEKMFASRRGMEDFASMVNHRQASVSLDCSKCDGELVQVEPVIEMGNKFLYECTKCHERAYKIKKTDYE